MTKALLVFDGECRFCTSTARWIELRSGGAIEARAFDDASVPTELAADRRRAHLVGGTTVRHGGAAVTGALRHVRGGRVAAVLDLPGVARLRDAVYRLVARRHGPHAAREDASEAGARRVAPPR
ncbi:MAG: DCC1-like thiol-disulfide oxidoreductase family protein [Dehalococcoidia bacterium]